MDALSKIKPTTATAAGVDSLTPRERECLLLVAEHLRSKQIARKLGLSPLTVDKYISSACERLAVNSRHEAAQLLTGAEGRGPPAGDPSDEPASPSLFPHLLARTHSIGERLDRWELGRRSLVRTAGQILSLYAIFSVIRVGSRRALMLLSDFLPPDLLSQDFLARNPAAHPVSLAAVAVGTYWDIVSGFALVTLTFALWRGRLPLVVTGGSILIGSLICEVIETGLRGPDVIRYVTLNDVIHTGLLAAWWTIYPRRWLAVCVGLEALMVAADFDVPSHPSLNGQLWIISQAYLTLFIMLVVAIAAGAWPWSGKGVRKFRDWLAGDLVPVLP